MSGMVDHERLALERLLAVARRDTGQSRRVADFLLAWWNAGSCGGFDMTTLWGLDLELAKDCATVFRYVALNADYPDALGYSNEFQQVVRAWRPELTI